MDVMFVVIVWKAEVNGVRNPALDFRLQFRDRGVLKVGFPHKMAYVTKELQPVIRSLTASRRMMEPIRSLTRFVPWPMNVVFLPLSSALQTA